MRVSVVTRTYRRPLLIARAARSVGAAKVSDMEWIIIDDDDQICAETGTAARSVPGIEVSVHCGQRGGRVAAANLGLRVAKGDLIHFHDDDDTVEPGFYRTVLEFLREQPRYKAVRTMCRRHYEEIDGSSIRTLKSRRIYPERRTVSLLDAAEVFAYPPIGSVFDRRTLLEIGGFDDRFDVGEDYELLLRFLAKADMGTIHECLANVHFRQRAEGTYSNSPISYRFEEEDMLFINTLIRRDLETGRFGLGFLLALGRQSRKRRGLLDYADALRKRVGL